MTEKDAIDEMMQGYLDGLDGESPFPSANRSYSYRHGFANGRADLEGRSRGTAEAVGALADCAIMQDTQFITIETERR